MGFQVPILYKYPLGWDFENTTLSGIKKATLEKSKPLIRKTHSYFVRVLTNLQDLGRSGRVEGTIRRRSRLFGILK